MQLELFFAADRMFQQAWSHAVCCAADEVLAQQASRELAGEPLATQITSIALEEIQEIPPGDGRSLQVRAGFPWPGALLAGHDTIMATFEMYVIAEVQHRLDLRAKG